MAPAIESENDQAATLNTVHTLASPTTAKTRLLRIDAIALVAGEFLEVTVEVPARTAGTFRTEDRAVFRGPLTDPIIRTIPSPSALGHVFKIKQTGGTGRTFPWSVQTLD